jgi:hypothetical protein
MTAGTAIVKKCPSVIIGILQRPGEMKEFGIKI